MSAQEFGEWITFLQHEQLTPQAGRQRHAQQIAAAHNGPLTRRDEALWQTSHFVPPDPWAPPAPPPAPDSAATLQQQVAALNARFEPP